MPTSPVRHRHLSLFVCVVAFIGAGVSVFAQQRALERQPQAVLQAAPPSARVTGQPGQMAIRQRECRAFSPAVVRTRIVQIAAQEWGYFGFAVVDRTDDGSEDETPAPRGPWGGRRTDPAEAARTAASIGGFWAVTADGGWIMDRQNEIWRRPDGEFSRWRTAWSAAFVSWVMCESGLASVSEFQRDVAHHRYIDQAIRARDGAAARAAYVAYEPGTRDLATGDLVCTARRPVYRTLAERRRQMGVGARTHCDIIVHVDAAAGRVLAIGGNVRGTVGLKAFPTTRTRGILRIVDPGAESSAPPIFAHLSLRSSYAMADPFATTPAVQALRCSGAGEASTWRTATALMPTAGTTCGP
jgi:hypothetical protein